MKLNRRSTFWVVLVAIVAAVAVSSVRSAEDPAPAGDRDAIAAQIEAMWSALGRHDRAAFSALCDDQWQLFTASARRLDVAQLFDLHEANVRGFELAASGLAVHVRGDVAWATYDATMAGTLKGEPWGGEFLMTNLFERRGGAWVCVHMHESRRPAE